MRLDLDGLDGVLLGPRPAAPTRRAPSTLPPSLRVQPAPLPAEAPAVAAPPATPGPLLFAAAGVGVLALVAVGLGALLALWPTPPPVAAAVVDPPAASAPVPAVADAAAPAEAPPPEPPLLPVPFAFDRADAPELPDALVRAAHDCAGTFELVGHTCALGTAETNHLIGLARATAVRDALIAAGVPAAGLSTRTVGADQPVAPQSTPEGRRANRRVEANCIQPSESP